MATLQDILDHHVLPSHCFTPQYYIKADIHTGLLESRGGYRLAAFPFTLLKSIYSGLRYETGQAARLILFNCGRDWGSEFFARVEDELSSYHHQPMGELPIGLLIDALSDLWSTHGWGKLHLNFNHTDQGIVVAETTSSGFARAAGELKETDKDQPQEPSCHLEAGVLASLFSGLAKRSLTCLQTACESMGHPQNLFIITAPDRLKDGQEWIRKGLSHQEIMDLLLSK